MLTFNLGRRLRSHPGPGNRPGPRLPLHVGAAGDELPEGTFCLLRSDYVRVVMKRDDCPYVQIDIRRADGTRVLAWTCVFFLQND